MPTMNPTQLRERLKDARMNLSALGRLSDVPLRTLRRIKNGDSEATPATVARVAPHLRKACKK